MIGEGTKLLFLTDLSLGLSRRTILLNNGKVLCKAINSHVYFLLPPLASCSGVSCVDALLTIAFSFVHHALIRMPRESVAGALLLCNIFRKFTGLVQ